MLLKFLGNETGFGKNHTSAYFVTEENDIVIIDCPVSAFHKLKEMGVSRYNTIYVLITHTHGDHVGGLGLFVQYAYFVLQKEVVIVAPSKTVKEDIETLLMIEGNECLWYHLTTADKIAKEKNWLVTSILTEHSPQLSGKCFGYQLLVEDKNVVYTGDTSTLTHYYPYLSKRTELYLDVSVHYGQIHIVLNEELIHEFIPLIQKNIKIYLMHLDSIKEAEKIVEEVPNVNVILLN